MTEVFVRTDDQRMAALRRANEIRTKRALLKRDLAAGAPYLELLADPPGWLESMKVHSFLVALPKLGVVKVRRIMLACRISEAKTVGGISGRQRVELLRALGFSGLAA